MTTTDTGVLAALPGPSAGRILEFRQDSRQDLRQDFRRRGTPPRRRRKSLLLSLLRPLTIAVVVVALPSGLVLWVLTAPLFRLRTVEVGGPARRVAPAWVRQVLAPLQGRNLVRLSLADATARLQSNPWIEKVEIEKELPAALRVKLAERRPVALLLSGQNLAYADTAGRPIAPVTTPGELEEARKGGLLVVSFVREAHPDGVGAALKVAAELGRVQPDWAAKLAQIEVLGEEDFRLHTDALPFPLLVTAGQVGPKVTRLVELLPELTQRYSRIEAVDLRFSRRIVVQPSQTALSASAGGRAERVKNTTSTF
ncbi:MAG TPA: FtsQ-type POTRA domain-containing protein [Thermoanaerobaculia bacterium]|jgi:cell division protein FtsQ|nr:FtsQ-type POTRA domain-containing protein [Thermoanaerobaculia bacterium]